ncbi:MAG: uracil-DNA glycosylase [Phycisphaerales bacterium]
MTTDARQLIAQHARTTQLLGVDFLPLGTPPAHLIQPPATQIEHKPEPEFRHDAHPAPSRDLMFAAAPPGGDNADTPGIQGVSLATLRAMSDALPDPEARLGALRARYEQDAPHKHFNTTFTSIVFGEGSPMADLMFVGEAPGEEEDITGRPFVGRAGQLLEKMIVAMGFSRQSVYICNVLKTRPPNNATPTSEEARLCAPYLLEQIRIIAPKVIVTLGLPASHLLLGTTSPMRSLRGQWHAFPPAPSASGLMGDQEMGEYPCVQVMPTYHPAYLLRSYTEENRRKVWSDLQLVMERLRIDSDA